MKSFHLRGTKRVKSRIIITRVSTVIQHYLLATLLAGSIASAQSTNTLVLPRLQGPIQLDGLSDEPAWQAVEPLPLTQHQPVFEGTPTERTEIRIAYDDEYLYASGRFYDSDPGGIRGNNIERDGDSPGDDRFFLILDTFNDNETALGFITTPAGNRIDFSIANDAQIQRRPGQSQITLPGNTSWNTFWDAAAVRNNEGWFAEMRIPFSSLRFQDDDGDVVMGLITSRTIARKNETVSYPAIEPRWTFGTMKPSVAQDVILEGVRSRNPLYITPYALGGISQSYDLNETESDYERIDDPSQELGLDLKYGLTSNLTLDLTINTDFAQAEADDERINLTRYSLFFPEKRLFFQERSSIFNFATGMRDYLFYSRRIGLSDLGPVPILGGVRLVGRLGPWDLGFLDMQTSEARFETNEGTAVTIPAENFGILRLRRQVLNENSYAGGMLTSRLGPDGNDNYAYGLDATLRLFGDDYLTAIWAQTFNTQDLAVVESTDNYRLSTGWERRSRDGLAYNFNFSYQGKNYSPGIGYMTLRDYWGVGPRISYSWLPPEASRIYRYNIQLFNSLSYRNSDGALESARIGPSLNVEWKSGASARVWIRYRYEDLPEMLRMPENTTVPSGSYPFYDVEAYYQMPYGRLLRAGIDFNVGSFYDGSIVDVGFSPTWTVSRFLSLIGQYQYTIGSFPDRDQSFSTQLISLRVQARANTRLSANIFIQYNSSVDMVGINSRMRYNPKEGTDFYLVYNESLNTDRQQESDPTLPLTNSRTILLKYSTTFLPNLSWTAW